MGTQEDGLVKINEILNNIHPIVMNRKIDKLIDLIKEMHEVVNKDLLRKCYNERGLDLITLTCKYNKKKHLNYLLQQSHILHYLTSESIAMKCKEDAFYYAMRSNQFEILEMLYDYWSGDLHWLGHKKEYNTLDVENLKQLNELLTNAFNKYEEYIKIKGKVNPQHMFNIQSLMAFNCFQKDLYSKLNELKANLITWEDEPEDIIRIQETYAIKSMILAMFDIHENHSKKDESMVENCVIEIKNEIIEGLTDTSTLLHRTRVYIIYEVFFRKMDYNFCLLILDNLHLLKLRLSLPDYSYQKLENKMYHFIYHTSSKWSLYTPKRKKIKTVNFLSKYNQKLCIFTVTYDTNIEESVSHMMYLERRDFVRSIKNFKKDLHNRCIEDNIRTRLIKLPNEDINSLMFLPNLRDDYSLKRISQHIAQLHSINIKYENKYVFLLIERTLQVVGEFLKSTDESLHLQPSTEALVKSKISVEVVNDLKTLRNVLCHTKNAELLKRIEVETNRSDIFDTVLTELLFVKKKIDEVINIFKPLVERDLIRNSMSTMWDRKNEMPDKAKIYFGALKIVRNMPPSIRSQYEENFYTDIWAPLGYSASLMKEVITLGMHFDQLDFKLTAAIKNVFKNVIQRFPFYKEKIINSFKTIMTCKEKWTQIVEALKNKSSSLDFLDYPNEEDANRMKSYSKKLVLDDDPLIQLIENNTLFSEVETHWNFIESLLDFIVNKTRIFNDTLEELEWNLFTDRLKELRESNYKKGHTEKILIQYLVLMESKVNEIKLKANNETFKEDPDTFPKFTGVKELTNKLMMANFLTQDEKSLLINDTLNIINSKIENKKSTAVKKTIDKIKSDIAIPKKEFNMFVDSTKLCINAQKILMNLVMGHKRDPLLPQCLSKRISLLREVTKNQTMDQLVLRYKLDKTFRVLLEVLLFDIFAIFEGNKNDEIVKKSSKLLTEINLRNVLTHGSALLEVVGNVLDSNDLATELVTKALDFMQDEISITALCTLTNLGFDFTEQNVGTLSPEQNLLLLEFKKSAKWNDYLQLISGYKQTIHEKRKKKPVIDEISMELLKAVNKKDVLSAQERINGGANVNFIDSHKKAVIHYAAMKGDINMMRVLIENGADVNIQNKENNLTALHYSAMNNFRDAVDYLLENGADCLALDDKGRTPVYWAGQRKHVNVCRVLRRLMKN